MTCFFIFLKLCYVKEKFLILMKSILSVLSFMDHASVIVSKRVIAVGQVIKISCMLSFVVSFFLVTSIHLAL